jgi:hypothetical protein
MLLWSVIDDLWQLYALRSLYALLQLHVVALLPSAVLCARLLYSTVTTHSCVQRCSYSTAPWHLHHQVSIRYRQYSFGTLATAAAVAAGQVLWWHCAVVITVLLLSTTTATSSSDAFLRYTHRYNTDAYRVVAASNSSNA